jgi:uncharacterized protein involved in exopolysaccharide biosynthesis
MKKESHLSDMNESIVVSLFEMRWLLLGLLGLGVSLGIFVLVFSESEYMAEVKTLPAEVSKGVMPDGGSLGALAGLAGIDIKTQSSIKFEALEILQSTTFINDFISSNDLLDDLYSEIWDAKSGEWRPPFWRRVPTIADGSRIFRKKLLRVREDRRSGIITVSIRWRNRNQAADWANELVSRLNTEMRHRAIDDADARLKYLKNQVEKTNNVGIKQAIYSLMESEIERAMLAEVREEYALRIIDRAHVPEERDRVWPKAGLLLVGGLFFGVLLAFVVVGASRIRKLFRTSMGNRDSAGNSA